MQATVIDPRDVTSFANLSLCLLKLREGERAVLAAQQCQKLRPCWAKAWYREGAGLSLLQVCVRAYSSHCIKLSLAMNLIWSSLHL